MKLSQSVGSVPACKTEMSRVCVKTGNSERDQSRQCLKRTALPLKRGSTLELKISLYGDNKECACAEKRKEEANEM
jgi:hypothetical protein